MATQRERADAERDSAEAAWQAVIDLQRENARLRSELADVRQKIVHTWEYADGHHDGTGLLPWLEGWSHFDAVAVISRELGDEDVFMRSLRPEGRGTEAPASVQPPKP